MRFGMLAAIAAIAIFAAIWFGPRDDEPNEQIGDNTSGDASATRERPALAKNHDEAPSELKQAPEDEQPAMDRPVRFERHINNWFELLSEREGQMSERRRKININLLKTAIKDLEHRLVEPDPTEPITREDALAQIESMSERIEQFQNPAPAPEEINLEPTGQMASARELITTNQQQLADVLRQSGGFEDIDAAWLAAKLNELPSLDLEFDAARSPLIMGAALDYAKQARQAEQNGEAWLHSDALTVAQQAFEQQVKTANRIGSATANPESGEVIYTNSDGEIINVQSPGFDQYGRPIVVEGEQVEGEQVEGEQVEGEQVEGEQAEDDQSDE